MGASIYLGKVLSAGTKGCNIVVASTTPAIDPDAQAFLTAAGITDATITSAINTLVVDLKAYSIWTKFKAIYPIVGGVASSHAVNLKTPGTYNLTFSTGWTHSSTGMTPNGTSAYADTGLNPNGVLASSNGHVSNYSRTQNSSINGVQMGAYDGVSEINLYQYYSGIARKGGSFYFYPTYAVLVNNTNTKGFQINTRRSASDAELYFNGVSVNTNTATDPRTTVNRTIYLGASNWSSGATQYSPHEHAFDSIGDGLTDTEAANFYTAVQAMQTTLSRNV